MPRRCSGSFSEETIRQIRKQRSEYVPVLLAIQDNRHSRNKYKEFTPQELKPNTDSFFVDVSVIDSNQGFVTSYTYKIDLDPLKVHEIIRVPTI